MFSDPKLAQQILSDLQVEPDVTAAALYDLNGKLFATYPGNALMSDFPATVPPNGIRFQGDSFTIYTPITQGQKRVGTLYLKSNLNLKEHLKIYAMVLLIILAGSGAVAWLLSTFFQRQISGPLRELANVAKAISTRKDFSVRAAKSSEDELGDLTDAFNSMLNQVQKSHEETLAASRAKDDFLAALSHELRTPLSPVLLIAGNAAANPRLPPETRADFEMIRRNVELEARLIDDLLDLTRVTHGKLALNCRVVNIHDILQEAVSTVKADAKAKHQQLVLTFRAVNQAVSGDAVRLQQIFWNVLKNAVKFTPDGGKITVKTFDQGKTLIVKIIDTGIGIKPEELSRVFNAFSQGDHANGGASHRFGGLGLGLAISRMLVEMHHGSIHAESAGSGQGAAFVVELPLVPTPDAAKLPAKPEKEPPAKTAILSRPLSILLVEDHDPTRLTLAQLLRLRNYSVTTAASLAEARSLAANGKKFDLLISDIGLPDGSGYDLMTELRQASQTLQGIALTGYGMEQDLSRSEAAGFAVHLTKPIGIEPLEKALKGLF